jgi:hypothetical protein
MVSEPHSVAYYNPTSILEGVCFRCGSKNGHQTNMFLIKNGLRTYSIFVNHFRFSSRHNNGKGDLYDLHMSMSIFTLINNVII